MASAYPSLSAFVDTCPQSDPYFEVLRHDFRILKDGAPSSGEIACTEPFTRMPVEQVSDELLLWQAIRFAYHLDMGRSAYLPWTQLRFYDWIRSHIAGINLNSKIVGGGCCRTVNGALYIDVATLASNTASGDTTVASLVEYRRSIGGLVGYIGFLAHEVRHTEDDGHMHVTGCPAFPNGVYGCDTEYDERNIGAYGIDYYLATEMLAGRINIGYTCDADSKAAVSFGLWNIAHSVLDRFVRNPPPDPVLPAEGGGPCIPPTTFTLSSAAFATGTAGTSLTVDVVSSNPQAGWTAASAVDWIRPVEGANSNGNNRARFLVAEGSTQPGKVVIAGMPLSVQCAGKCSFTVSNVIEFGAIDSVKLGSAPFPVSARASSGLSVLFSTSSRAVCSVSSGMVTVLSRGTCAVTASQPGNAVFPPATPVVREFAVTGEVLQEVAFAPVANVALGARAFRIDAKATSGLPVAFVSTTPTVCTVSGNTVTAISAGTCIIGAVQPGDATYAAAAPVSLSFAVFTPPDELCSIDATFKDGAKMRGFFVFKRSSKTFSQWRVSIDGGTAPGFPPLVFDTSNSGLGFASSDTERRSLVFFSRQMVSPVPGANPKLPALSLVIGSSLFEGNQWLLGGTTTVQWYSRVAGLPSDPDSCTACNPRRTIDTGTVRLEPSPLAVLPGGIVPIYGSTPVVQPGEWFSIFGTKLASANVGWKGDFPTVLGGTSVTINGKPAYLSYVSPTQINAQAPDDSSEGPVEVVVTTPDGSFASTVTLAKIAPSFSLLDAKHPAAIIIRSDGSGSFGGGAYDILGPAGSPLGYKTVPAAAGDTVVLFGTGFGSTTPPVPAGQPFVGAAPTSNPVTLMVGGAPVPVQFAGLSATGLIQINFVVPPGLPAGELPVAAQVGGAQTQNGVVLTVK